MYQLQVLDSDKYRTLAEENRIKLRLLTPLRGRILDRFGRALAINQENYRVSLVAEQVQDIDTLLDSLSHIFVIGDSEREKILKQTQRRRGFVPVMIRENVKWEDVSRLEVNAPDLPGLLIEVGQNRRYPFAHD